MDWITTALRRSLWLVLIAGVGGAAWAWRRDRPDAQSHGAAEWPLLTPQATNTVASTATEPSATEPSAPSEPTAESVTGWVLPLDDGSCPLPHPIKANDNSGIFHVPGGRFYDRTGPERCYSTPEAAVADGYRQAKN